MSWFTKGDVFLEFNEEEILISDSRESKEKT
jgi:hypothetical protein